MCFYKRIWQPGPDLPIGLVRLSLRPQDLRRPAANCGTHNQFQVYDIFHKYSSTIYVLAIHEIWFYSLNEITHCVSMVIRWSSRLYAIAWSPTAVFPEWYRLLPVDLVNCIV